MKRELEEAEHLVGDELEGMEGLDEPREASPSAKRYRGKGGGKKGKGGGGPKRLAFKVLCPDAFVSSLIGIQGATRKAIEEESGGKLRFSGKEEFYPNSRCRTLVIYGDEAPIVLAALDRIVMRLVDTAENLSDRTGKGGRDDPETLMGKEPGEYVLRIALPKESTGRLIGPKGTSIKKLREETNAKVFVDNETFEGHQLARVIGPPDTINAALVQIVDCVESEMSAERLVQWGQQATFEQGSQHRRGRSRDREPRRNDKEEWNHRSGSQERRPRERDEIGDFPPMDAVNAPLEAMQSLAGSFPTGALQLAHAVSCDLPNHCVGALIGTKGKFINHVQRTTETTVTFSEAPKGSEVAHRTLMIQGPLISVYAAHMMMMRKYHEEELKNQEEASRESERISQSAVVDQLQTQLADLERQLHVLRSDGSPAAGGCGGGGRPRKGGKGSR